MTRTLRAQRRLRLSCSSQIRKLSTRDESRSRPRGTLCLPEQISIDQLPNATPGWAKYEADAGRNLSYSSKDQPVDLVVLARCSVGLTERARSWYSWCASNYAANA